MVLPIIKNKFNEFGEDRTEIHRYRVDYKDVFDMQYVYYVMREWFIENQYTVREDPEFPEKLMIVRDNPSFGKELWIQWRFQKEIEPKKAKMWRFDIDVDWHILGMKDVEIVIQGKKVRAQKGQLELDVRANLIFDYEKAFGKSILKSHKRWFYQKFHKKTYSKYKRLLTEDATKLQDAIKEYLRIQKYLYEQEMAFWDQKPG